jgi:hypothetical protein
MGSEMEKSTATVEGRTCALVTLYPTTSAFKRSPHTEANTRTQFGTNLDTIIPCDKLPLRVNTSTVRREFEPSRALAHTRDLIRIDLLGYDDRHGIAGNLNDLAVLILEANIDLWFTLPTKCKTCTVVIQDIWIAIA